MRVLLALLAFLALSAWAQQPPVLGLHEFGTISVTPDTSASFPADARVVQRNYTVQDFGGRVLRAVGFQLAVANTSNSVGVAFDVVAGAISTLFDAAVGIGYYGARAGVKINPGDNTVVRILAATRRSSLMTRVGRRLRRGGLGVRLPLLLHRRVGG